jgi:hypothetical protein
MRSSCHWSSRTQSPVHWSPRQVDFDAVLLHLPKPKRTHRPARVNYSLCVMFPSFSQRGRIKAERSSRALAIGDSISSFQYDFTLEDDFDDESVTGISFADETSISNLDEIFLQRPCTVDESIPDLVFSSPQTDYGSSSSPHHGRNSFDVRTPFGVSVVDLFRSFEEHLSSQQSHSKKVLKKRHRSRRRGFGSSHGNSRHHYSDNLRLNPEFISPNSEGRSSWNGDTRNRINDDDDDIYMQLRGKRNTMSFDYLPATRQQSLQHSLSERSKSQRTLISSPLSASRQGTTIRRKTQHELKVALFREFGVKSENDAALTKDAAMPLHDAVKHSRESLEGRSSR